MAPKKDEQFIEGTASSLERSELLEPLTDEEPQEPLSPSGSTEEDAEQEVENEHAAAEGEPPEEEEEEEEDHAPAPEGMIYFGIVRVVGSEKEGRRDVILMYMQKRYHPSEGWKLSAVRSSGDEDTPPSIQVTISNKIQKYHIGHIPEQIVTNLEPFEEILIVARAAEDDGQHFDVDLYHSAETAPPPAPTLLEKVQIGIKDLGIICLLGLLIFTLILALIFLFKPERPITPSPEPPSVPPAYELRILE